MQKKIKTAIIYISKHRTTKKVARIIADKLNLGKTELTNLSKEKKLDIKTFGRIVNKGSIHMASA